MPLLELRITSLNLSGGEKIFEEFSHDTHQSRQEALQFLIRHLNADLLCLQEVSQYIDVGGVLHTPMDYINHTGGYGFSNFGETISMQSHLQVKKEMMVDGVFNDWQDWSKGNAIHSKIPFARLGDPSQSGSPRNIPLYQPVKYEGSRDTDPRFVLLTRLKASPFPYVANLHLTTLVGERMPERVPERVRLAKAMRRAQVERLLDLVRKHILNRNEPLITVGDFNATPEEACISNLLEAEAGFVRLVPTKEGPTHAGSEQLIDHIFFYPKERLLDYNCWIESGDLSKRVSDHLPVVADIRIK